MAKIETEILINADIETVWKNLIDFENYNNWNPFVVQASGKIAQGQKVDIWMIQKGKKYHFKPRIEVAEVNRLLIWEGSLPIPYLFTGRHCFELKAVSAGQTQFLHYELFKGLLVGYFLKEMGSSTRDGFNGMNQALKHLCENQTA